MKSCKFEKKILLGPVQDKFKHILQIIRLKYDTVTFESTRKRTFFQSLVNFNFLTCLLDMEPLM